MKVRQIQYIKSPVPRRIRVAAYARVSVDFEDTEHSLESQVSHFIKRIEGNPAWEFAGVYSDLGKSGTKADRKGFSEMMEDARAGRIDRILTKSISRFARNTVTLLDTVRELKSLGIGVIFEREGIDTLSSEGELLLTLLASFAQEESRSHSENVKWAIDKRYQKGIPNVYILYGYRWTGDGFALEEEEAAVVRRIFRLYLVGSSPCEISNMLTEEEVRPPRSTLRFHESKVWEILRCEAYTGDTTFHREYIADHLTHKRVVNKGEKRMYHVEDAYPAIISKELFLEVQEEIRRRAELGYLANRNKDFTCFTGHIYCARCNRTYRRKIQYLKYGKRYYWQCGTRFDKTTSACSACNIPEKILVALTCEVLCITELDDEIFNSRISKIIAGGDRTLLFVFKDGMEVLKKWEVDHRGRVIYEEVKSA